MKNPLSTELDFHEAIYFFPFLLKNISSYFSNLMRFCQHSANPQDLPYQD